MKEVMLSIKNITKLENNSVYAIDFDSRIISAEALFQHLRILNEKCKPYNIIFIPGKW